MPFEPVKAPVTALYGSSVNPPFLPHKLRSRAELEWSMSHSSVEHAPLKCGKRSTQVFQRYGTSFAGEPSKLVIRWGKVQGKPEPPVKESIVCEPHRL